MAYQTFCSSRRLQRDGELCDIACWLRVRADVACRHQPDHASLPVACVLQVAFIPLSSILLSSFQCEDPYLPFWRDAGFFCFQGAHLAISIISAVLGSAFVACCTVFAGLVYDSHSLTPNLAGKAHGRVDVALLLLKTALVITIDVLPHMMGGPWTLIGLNIGGGVAWTWMVYSYMPFVSVVVTRHIGGMAG